MSYWLCLAEQEAENYDNAEKHEFINEIATKHNIPWNLVEAWHSDTEGRDEFDSMLDAYLEQRERGVKED